jgi:tRNA (cytidine/uridine-2'-O-)-methyltransferase
MRLALYRPEIPFNVGAVLRLGACMDTPVDLIEPMGFAWDERRVARAAMDYIAHVEIARHADWPAFLAQRPGRLVLLTTKADVRLHDFAFAPGDVLLFGRESAGVPPEVHDRADARIAIPMRAGLRSLNLAMSAAIALTEALRQTGGLPGDAAPGLDPLSPPG